MDFMEAFKVHGYCLCILFLNGFYLLTDGARLPEVQIQSVVVVSPTKIQLSWRPSYKGKKRNKKNLKFQMKLMLLQQLNDEQRMRSLIWDYVDRKRQNGVILVDNITSRSAAISWHLNDDTETEDRIQAFKVTWRNKRTDARKHSVVQARELRLNDLEPDTQYTVSVYMFTDTGDKVKLDTVRFDTLPLLLAPPGNVKIKWTTHTKMLVKWRHLPPGGANVTGYVVQYKRRGGTEPTCELTVNVTKRMATLKGLRSDTRYGVRLAAVFDGVIGPFSVWLKERTKPFSSTGFISSHRHLRVDKIPLPVGQEPGGQDIIVQWSPRVDVTHAEIAIKTGDPDVPLAEQLLPRSEYMLGIYAFDRDVKDSLNNGDHVIILKEHTGSCPRYKHGLVYINETSECVATRCWPHRNTSLLQHTFLPYLRLLPLPDGSHVVAWLPYPSNNTWVYQVILYRPGFISEHVDATYYVPKNRSSLRLTSLEPDSYHLVRVQAWMDTPTMDVFMYRTLEIRQIGNEINHTVPQFDFWALTSLDLLVETRPLVNANAGVDVAKNNKTNDVFSSDDNYMIDKLDDTPWSLLMTQSPGVTLNVTSRKTGAVDGSGEDGITMEISMRSPVPPQVTAMENITAHEDMVLLVRCLATGDPYPTLSWVIPEADGNTTYAANFTSATLRTQSGHITTRYLGATTPVNQSVYLASESSINIYTVRLSHEGWYQCSAGNEAGTHQAAFYLHVIGRPPTKVQDLRANSTTPYSLLVEWMPPNDTRDFPVKPVIGYRLVLIDKDGVTLREGNTSDVSYMYQDLSPATTFEVQVSAYNSDTEGAVAVVEATTQRLPMLGPPTNTSATTVNASVTCSFHNQPIIFPRIATHTDFFHIANIWKSDWEHITAI